VPLLQSYRKSWRWRVFPQPVKPNLFSILYGTAEAVPFQNSFEKAVLGQILKKSFFGGFEDGDCLDRQHGR
jgi:hypothetical protein